MTAIYALTGISLAVLRKRESEMYRVRLPTFECHGYERGKRP